MKCGMTPFEPSLRDVSVTGTQAGVGFLMAAAFMQAWVISARLWVGRDRLYRETLQLAQSRIGQLELHLRDRGIEPPSWAEPPPGGWSE